MARTMVGIQSGQLSGAGFFVGEGGRTEAEVLTALSRLCHLIDTDGPEVRTDISGPVAGLFLFSSTKYL